MAKLSLRTVRPDPLWVGVALFFALFLFNSLTRTRQFPYDAMNYADVAQHVLQGDGLVQTTVGMFQPHTATLPAEGPIPFVAQGPLFPLLIAGVARLGLGVHNAALGLSALGYLVVLILGARLGRRVGGPSGGWLALAALLSYAPLAQAGRTALTEAVALALVLGSLSLLSPMRGRVTPLAALGAGTLAGLAFDTRYALIWLVVLGLVWLWHHGYRSLLAFLLGAALATVPVLVHNFVAGGVLLPQPLPSNRGFLTNLQEALLGLVGNIFVTERHVLPQAVLTVLGLAVLLAKRGLRVPPSAALLWLWPLVYTTGLIFQRSRVHFDPLDSRLLLPAGVALLLCLTVVPLRTRTARVLALLALLLAVGRELKLLKMPLEAPAVVRSPRLAWLAKNTQPTDRIVGDDAMDIPFFLGHRRVISLSAYPYNEPLTWEKLRTFGPCVVVVRPADTANAASYGPLLAALKAGRIPEGTTLTHRATLPDAHIYAVTAAVPSAPPAGLR